MLRRLALAAVAAPTLLCASCVEDGASLSIECNSLPTVEDGTCIYDPNNETCVIRGRLNLRFASSYTLTLVVSNGLFPREQTIPVMAEPNDLDVVRAEVEVQNTAGAPIDFGGLPNPFTVRSSGRVPVGGRGIASINALPRDYVQVMREQSFDVNEGTVVLAVQLTGETDGLVTVESKRWLWPVEVIDADFCRSTDDENAMSCAFGQDEDAAPYCFEIQ